MPHDLMNYTPRALAALFEADAMLSRQRQRDIIASAWHTAKYQLMGKKFPKALAPELRAFREPVKPMSDMQLRRGIINAHKRMGGSVRYVPKGTLKQG